MTDIAPSLIQHLPPVAQAPQPRADARAERNICGGMPTAVKITAPFAVTLAHADAMQPALLPTLAPATETPADASGQTLVCRDAQLGVHSSPGCMAGFSQLMQRRHGIPSDAATALCLAALSAAAGPGRSLKNPLGGGVSAALNVIVEDAAPAAVRRAANQALRPFQAQVERRIAAHQEKGTKHLRQCRMELDPECAQAVHRLHSPPERPRQPLTIPVPAGERKKEALAETIEEAEQVAQRQRLFEFEERPFLVVDGLFARDVPAIAQRAFDGAVLNFYPGGDALRQLETLCPADRREVLRYLAAAWHGTPFAAGSQTLLNPSVTNLWLLETGGTARAWRHPAMAASGLLETFLVAANDAPMDMDPGSFTAAAADDDWRDLLDVVLGERIMGEASEHHLSEPARRRFLEFHAGTAQGQTADSRKFAAWWPEQALKVALLLHLDTGASEVPVEIGPATMEEAVRQVERLGAAQRRAAASADPQEDFDAEIEIMAAKVRLHGPLRKRDLFRKYNAQEYRRLEPILALCRDRQQLRLEGDLIYPAALPG